MIDNKIRGRIIGVEKLPACVEKDFHDSEVLYINYPLAELNSCPLKSIFHQDAIAK